MEDGWQLRNLKDDVKYGEMNVIMSARQTGKSVMNRKSHELLIFEDILVELDEQDRKFSSEFDSKNTANDWVVYIARYASKASNFRFDRNVFRKAMVQTAALAVSAIKWCDKGNYKIGKRHYD